VGISHPTKIKLLFCLVSGLVVAILALELRQQRLDYGREAVRLHDQIEARQTTLWNQQLQIATYTAPNAISKTIARTDLQQPPAAPIGTSH
jgi:cell division protein FtsL